MAHVALEADEELPALPKPDRHGRFLALQYARISLARDLIRDRKGVGLTRQRLADLAGIRQETLSRIETGKHVANQRTVEKIMRGHRRRAAAVAPSQEQIGEGRTKL